MAPVVARAQLLRVPSCSLGRGEDGHGPTARLLVRSPVQGPGVILERLLVREICAAVIMRKVPVNVDIFKHGLFTGKSVKKLQKKFVNLN